MAWIHKRGVISRAVGTGAQYPKLLTAFRESLARPACSDVIALRLAVAQKTYLTPCHKLSTPGILRLRCAGFLAGIRALLHGAHGAELDTHSAQLLAQELAQVRPRKIRQVTPLRVVVTHHGHLLALRVAHERSGGLMAPGLDPALMFLHPPGAGVGHVFAGAFGPALLILGIMRHAGQAILVAADPALHVIRKQEPGFSAAVELSLPETILSRGEAEMLFIHLLGHAPRQPGHELGHDPVINALAPARRPASSRSWSSGHDTRPVIAPGNALAIQGELGGHGRAADDLREGGQLPAILHAAAQPQRHARAGEPHADDGHMLLVTQPARGPALIVDRPGHRVTETRQTHGAAPDKIITRLPIAA